MSKARNSDKQLPGLGWRTSLTILVSIGWLIFLIILFFFYSTAFNFYQNIALALLSTMILFAIMVSVWVPWGLRYGAKQAEIDKIPGLKWRISVSVATAIIWFVVFTVWFYFYACSFTLYQNLGIVVLSLAFVAVIVGLTLRPMWADYMTPRFKQRIATSAIFGLAASLFLFVWLFFYADGYSFYQNVAVVIVPLTIWSVAQSLAGGRRVRRETALTGLRLTLSAIVALGWMVFAFVWLYYYAWGYGLLENAVIFIVSLIIMGAIQGFMHAPPRGAARTPGLRWRVALSAVMGVGWLVFIVIWLFYYAAGYSFPQNIAIIVVSLLVVGAVLGATWAPWGIKTARRSAKRQ